METRVYKLTAVGTDKSYDLLTSVLLRISSSIR